MHIPQRTLQLVAISSAILVFSLAAASPAKAAIGILTPPLFFYTSTGALSRKLGNVWFGKVMLGSSETLSATLSNTGTVNITISSVSETGAGYSLSGLSFPMTLGPGNSAKFQVTFGPQSLGHVDGTFGFTSDASSSTLYLAMHGTGAKHGHAEPKPFQHKFRHNGAGQMRDSTRVARKYGRG